MKKFIRLFILLSLLLATAIYTSYTLNKDWIYEEILLRTSSELSNALNQTVEIESLQDLSLWSATFSGISVKSSISEGDLLYIKSAKIVISPLSVLLEKRFSARIYITNLKFKDTTCNAEAKIVFNTSDTYKDIFDTSLLDAIFLLDGNIQNKSMLISELYGTAEMDGINLTEIKMRLGYKNVRYFITLSPSKEEDKVYSLVLRSKDLGFRTAFSLKNDTVSIKSLRGMFYTLNFDLKGELRDLASEDRTLSINGTLSTNLESLSILPGDIGKLAQDYELRGRLSANAYLKATSSDISTWEASVSCGGTNLKVDGFLIHEVNGKFALREGRVTSPLISCYLYGGSVTSDLILDVLEKDFPYMLSSKINNIDYGKLIYDVTDGQEKVSGNLTASLSLKGYATDSSTAEGTLAVTIDDADLGPMPLLTPLLGEWFVGIENIFQSPDQIVINAASADCTIKNLKLSSENITFTGEDIIITGKGHMDFAGTLDFLFQNKFTSSPDPETETWQEKVRSTITQLGRKMGQAHLRGTIKEPIWDFKFGNQS